MILGNRFNSCRAPLLVGAQGVSLLAKISRVLNRLVEHEDSQKEDVLETGEMT